MGTEAAPIVAGIPFAVCLVVLLVFALTERNRSDRPERILGLGRGRLARGYLGALGVVLILSILDASPQRRLEIALLYDFPGYGLMLVAFLTLLFLPILALLRKFGFASLLGVCCVGVGIAGGAGLAFDGVVLLPAAVGGILAVAFSLAADLPLVRSHAA